MRFHDGILTPAEPAIDLVRLLSAGTYTSFPQALKEFVSNSFDADAERVEILVDDDANGITIRDNGEGMTLTDFGDAFASLARSGKPGKGVKLGRTKSGRVKIGRFGIGTLAVIAICDRFTVRSTREYSTEGFVAKMDVAALRRRFGLGENLSDCWKFNAEKWNTEALKTHFTEIRLEGLAPEIRSFLEKPGEKKFDETTETVTQLSGLDQLAWRLGLICPVAYAATFPIRKKDLNPRTDAVLIERARRLLRDRFSVVLNNQEVKRDIQLPEYKDTKKNKRSEYVQLMKRGLGYQLKCFRSPTGAAVRYEGYLVVQAQQLFPQELRGLLVRLRGVAVGHYKTFHLTGSSISTMLPTLSGEIWVESGLEEALQFDRESFREDHPNFQWFAERIEKEVEAESKGFRERSQKRANLKKRKKNGAQSADNSTNGKNRTEDEPKPQSTTLAVDTYIDPEIFRECPTFISFLVPQINGCWNHQWHEACALTIRRLLETLIIHLYEKRGWVKDIRGPDGYLGLQSLVDKLSSDGRVGLDKRHKQGLEHLKVIGDTAAHDYRIRVRKSDLEQKRTELRLTCERLIFIANNQGN